MLAGCETTHNYPVLLLLHSHLQAEPAQAGWQAQARRDGAAQLVGFYIQL